jgi:hypothetical protein
MTCEGGRFHQEMGVCRGGKSLMVGRAEQLTLDNTIDGGGLTTITCRGQFIYC